MKLFAKIGTFQIVYDSVEDLAEKVRKQKEELEQEMAKMQEQWEQAGIAYRAKIAPIRKNVAEFQEAFRSLSEKIILRQEELKNNEIPGATKG